MVRSDEPLPAEPSEPSEPSEQIQASESSEPYRTVVRPQTQDDGLDAQRRIDRATPGFATAVDLQAEPGARPSDAMAEVVARTPGATVRSVGGLGQFSAVSLRGSSPQQVQVFIDGVPIGSALAGLVDLGDLPLAGLTRLEIYRGHVPVAFGGSTIGGAINLVSEVSPSPPRLRVRGGIGSFGARESGASVSLPIAAGQLTTRVSYAGAEGDFVFYDDGGTPGFSADDTTTKRRNNGYDRLLGQVRFDGRRGPWRYGVQELVVLKRRGEPGPASVQSTRASLSQVLARTTASAEHDRFGRPGGRLQWVAGLGVMGRRFDDPAGQIGLGLDDERTLGVDGYLSPRLRHPLWKGAFLGVVADARPEWIRIDQRAPQPTARSGDATRSRVGLGIGAELEQFLFEHRWLLVPAIRLDALVNRFAVSSAQGEPGDAGSDHLAFGFAPRLGTRVRIVDALQLRGSAGRYFRAPTLLELFGDRGYFVGNEGLRPERGTAVDGGLVLDLRGQAISVYGQLAGFATYSEDLIQWIAVGTVSRPENLAAARIRGLESALEVVPRSRALTVSANYTLTDARDRSDDASRRGRPLPGRPRHDLFTRASAGWEWRVRGVPLEPRAFYTVEVIASTFLDPSGRLELPPRAIQGLGGELHLARRIHLALEVRNLLDVRTGVIVVPLQRPTPVPTAVSDFLGYPLPGRSAWMTLRVDMELPSKRRNR